MDHFITKFHTDYFLQQNPKSVVIANSLINYRTLILAIKYKDLKKGISKIIKNYK